MNVHGLYSVLWILYSWMVNLNFKAFQFFFSLSQALDGRQLKILLLIDKHRPISIEILFLLQI